MFLPLVLADALADTTPPPPVFDVRPGEFEETRAVEPPKPPGHAFSSAPCPSEAACVARCDAGDAPACEWVGERRTGAQGVSKYTDIARYLYTKACFAGDAASCLNAGNLYEDDPRVWETEEQLQSAVKVYDAGCELGTERACASAKRVRKVLSEPRVSTAVLGRRVQNKTRSQLEEECDRGTRWGACFVLGRTFLTGLFAGAEGVRLGMTPGATERTGLGDGWGAGSRFGVDAWNWLAVNVGFRGVSPSDSRPLRFQEPNCPEGSSCKTTEREVSATGFVLSAEAGFQHSFRLEQNFGVMPALLVGYAGSPPWQRTVDDCSSCPSQDVTIHGGAYLATMVRFPLPVFAPFVRYERYLGGDFTQALTFGVDVGAWANLLVPTR